ncbi:MAG: tetratricopeptide repeat protein [Ruminococcus sp.]|nr:tetratricopeptide repeat protein [Ruminococcus sp.]
MYCQNCGTKNNIEDTYCMGCGAPLLEQKEEITEKPKKSNTKLWIVIITEILLIACAIVAILIFPRMRSEKQYNNLVVLAERYFEELNYEKAEAAYLEAISIDPMQETPYMQLAEIYMQQGQGERAKEVLLEGYVKTGSETLYEKYQEYAEVIKQQKEQEEEQENIQEQEEIAAPTNEKAPYAEDGYIHSYRLGTTVSYDLNGDGTEEEIKVTNNDDAPCRITINGTSIEGDWLMEPTGYYAIINIDGTGNELIVGVSEYGPSADPMTYLYAYDGNSIINVGSFDDILGETQWEKTAFCNGDGTITANTRMDVLGTWGANAIYIYSNHTLTDATDFYSYAGYWGNGIEWDATTNYALEMYEGENRAYPKVVVPAGTVVYMTGCKRMSENECWVAFRLDTSDTILWLPVETSGWPCMVKTLQGKMDSEKVFDGYHYAG